MLSYFVSVATTLSTPISDNNTGTTNSINWDICPYLPEYPQILTTRIQHYNQNDGTQQCIQMTSAMNVIGWLKSAADWLFLAHNGSP